MVRWVWRCGGRFWCRSTHHVWDAELPTALKDRYGVHIQQMPRHDHWDVWIFDQPGPGFYTVPGGRTLDDAKRAGEAAIQELLRRSQPSAPYR